MMKCHSSVSPRLVAKAQRRPNVSRDAGLATRIHTYGNGALSICESFVASVLIV